MTGEKDAADLCAENAQKDAPPEMPGVEEIARALIAHFVEHTGFTTVDEDETKTCVSAYYGGVWVDLRVYPIARAILDLFAPILAEKERERDEARADLAKLMDPELKHLRIEGGAIDLALTGPIVQHMGLVLSEHFRASGAENYIEMTYHAKTEPFETYVWTIQKRVGSNSPHDLRAKAEARALAAEAALETVVWALNVSRVAVDDWLNVYASELCDAKRVAQAQARISDSGGTLAYIARVQDATRDALAQIAAPGAAMEAP